MSFKALEESNRVNDYKREKKMLKLDETNYPDEIDLKKIDLFDAIGEQDLDIFECFS